MTDTWFGVIMKPQPKKEMFVMGQKKRYDKAFKLQAARLVVECGYSCKEAAR